MLIRKNSKEYKALLHIFEQHSDAKIRNKFFKLFIVKAGEKLEKKIPIETIPDNAEFYWRSTLETVLANLKSATHQLQYEAQADLYYFHSGQNKSWDESPFQISPAVRKKFSELAALLPKKKKDEKVPKKKENKQQKWVPGKSAPQAPATPSKATKIQRPKPGKLLVAKTAPANIKPTLPKPLFNLKHRIDFHHTDKIVFPELGLKKIDILKYYERMAPYILPYLKGRPVCLQSGKKNAANTPFDGNLDNFKKNHKEPLPSWIKTITYKLPKEKTAYQFITCPDKAHLLFLVEIGCVEISTWNSRENFLDRPDYAIIALETGEKNSGKLIEVVRHAKLVLDALHLPSYLKTSSDVGLHLCIPLDGRNEYTDASAFCETICKLIHLKIPQLTSLKRVSTIQDAKIYLNFSPNTIGYPVVAPYSLRQNSWAGVAAPLTWDALTLNADLRQYNYSSVFKTIEKQENNFSEILKKGKVNSKKVALELKSRYGFLL